MIDTILVVEDEKMIRQGIATMIRRCDVEIGEVLECPDGEKAMEILKSRPVDLVFTDIRMPKMNGIQLVQKMQQLDEVPMCVAISGYDDFDYAVQMLRRGVKEYILKPVEREKIREVVARLDGELTAKKKDRDLTRLRGSRLLRYLLMDKDATPEEMKDLENLLRDHLGGSFAVLVANRIEKTQGISLSVNSETVLIASADVIEEVTFQKKDDYIGVSDICTFVTSLKKAYEQALDRRKRAFLEGIGVVREDKKAIPERLLSEAEKLTREDFITAAVQRIGAAKDGDALADFERLFKAAGRGYVPSSDFEGALRTFCTEFTSVYKRQIPEGVVCPYLYDRLTDYEEGFLVFISQISGELAAGGGESEMDKKMREAVAYIREHYREDLSMTVVSNVVSMNYTLFSSQFKQYTGDNFVSYVRKLRIDEAKRLLTESDRRIFEIGTAVGYDNEKHFLKSFKSLVGVTPSEYRKNTSR